MIRAPSIPQGNSPKALLVGLAVLLVQSGCVLVQPSSSSPSAALPVIAVPDQWTRNAAIADSDGNIPASSTVLTEWWRRFNDEELGQLVSAALAANTSVASAQAALRQGRALRDAQAAKLWPSLKVSGSAERSKSDASGASDIFDAGFDAGWEPDIFGANRSALRAADADALQGAADLADVQVSVAAEVAVTYMQLRGAQTRLAIARDNLATQIETLQLTDWRVQAGLATSLEAEQARTSSEQTRAQIPSLVTSIAQARHSLAVLTGQTPQALEQQLAQSSPVPMAPDDLVLSIPGDTLRQRPDVRAAEEQFRAALARWTQATANRFPDFQLSGSFGLRAATIDALTGGGSTASALLASVSLPLFDAGALRAQERAQQAALDQVRASYQAVVLGALQEVEDALVALQGDRERLARLRDAAEAAGNAWLLAQQRYAGGLIDFQTVLDTQRTLLSTQDSVATTAADLSGDHVRLYKALGGGWQPDTMPSSSRVRQ